MGNLESVLTSPPLANVVYFANGDYIESIVPVSVTLFEQKLRKSRPTVISIWHLNFIASNVLTTASNRRRCTVFVTTSRYNSLPINFDVNVIPSAKRSERTEITWKTRRKLVSCDLLFIQISKGTAPQRQLSEGKRKGNAGIRCASSHTA